MLLQLLSAVVASLTSFVSLSFLGVFINQLVGGQAKQTGFFLLGAFVMVVFLLNAIGQWLAVNARLQSQALNMRARSNMAKHLVEVDYTTFIDGEFRNRYSATKTGLQFTGGFEIYINSFLNQLVTLVTTSVLAAGLVVTLLVSRSPQQTVLAGFVNSPFFIVVLVILVVLPLLAAVFFSKRGSAVLDAFFAANIKLNQVLSYYFEIAFKSVSVAKTLRLFDPKDSFLDEANKQVIAGVSTDTELQLKYNQLAGMPGLITGACVGALYILVASKALTGAISVGFVVASVGYLQVLILALSGLFNAWGNRRAAMRTIDDYTEFMAMGEVGAQPGLPLKETAKFRIQFEHVSYRYRGQTGLALDDINLRIDEGERIAVVGPNGSGKSTFVKLLIGLIKPTSGRILFNGEDVQQLDHIAYQRLFGVVAQDFFVFATSIAENIVAGTSPRRQELDDSLRLSGLADRVADLPAGSRTPATRELDAQGVSLSGGEAQKLAIARAIYQQPEFLVLDEPTAALDPLAEVAVYQNFDQMIQGKTGLYVSHRMSSTRFSQKIYVFNQAKLVAQGTHESLMAENGLYAELFNAQAQYYQDNA
ncbi:abc transporter, multidrug transporter atpase and permease component [Lacticaseibacillus brantae DSM 23927]|uniref:Abc transporter, multidrug transporter atpase and permease component n=1 Tax=Lacticaseibacillus brantae DSM 23927 TaxID=1423727 RepID=A0A0R2B716_9LACO|nr:abc transporter, multidrug transporter atpase and permease component [Lacticaseibacillus brantae DSM 23927]